MPYPQALRFSQLILSWMAVVKAGKLFLQGNEHSHPRVSSEYQYVVAFSLHFLLPSFGSITTRRPCHCCCCF